MSNSIEKATPKQIAYLTKLGATKEQLKGLDIRSASKLISQLKNNGTTVAKKAEKATTQKTESKKAKAKSKADTPKSSVKTEKVTETKKKARESVSMTMSNNEQLVNWLESEAKKDKTFAKKLDLDKIDECVRFIGNEVYKKAVENGTKGNFGAMVSDEDVFAMAKHFYLDVLGVEEDDDAEESEDDNKESNSFQFDFTTDNGTKGNVKGSKPKTTAKYQQVALKLF